MRSAACLGVEAEDARARKGCEKGLLVWTDLREVLV